MNYLIGIALGLWLVVFPTAVLLLLRVDRSHDRVWEVERPAWADDDRPLDSGCPLDSEGYPFPEASEPIYEALHFERWEAEL